jgi:hypothetical protein
MHTPDVAKDTCRRKAGYGIEKLGFNLSKIDHSNFQTTRELLKTGLQGLSLQFKEMEQMRWAAALQDFNYMNWRFLLSGTWQQRVKA